MRESTSAEELHGFIDSDEADIALMPAPQPDRFTVTVVADEEIVLAAPSDHPIARQSVVRLQDLDGVRLVHFAPENGLSSWLDLSLTKAGVRPEPVMRTSVTAAAPQLAAAGLGVAVCPVSAVSAGFPGAVRSFSPCWIRQLAAVTPRGTRPARRAVHRQPAQSRRAGAPRRAISTHWRQLSELI